MPYIRLCRRGGWAVVLSDSQSEIYREAYANRNILLLICAGAYVLIVLLVWISVRLCVRPLNVVKKSIIHMKEIWNFRLQTS